MTATSPSSWASARRRPRTPRCPCRGISARQAPTLCGPSTSSGWTQGHAFKLGQTVGVAELTEVARVDVTGVTQGQGFPGRHQAPWPPPRPGGARLEERARPRLDRHAHLPGSRASRQAHGRPDGQQAADQEEPDGRRDRPGAEPVAGQGQRARRQERNRFHPAQPLVAERDRRTGQEKRTR